MLSQEEIRENNNNNIKLRKEKEKEVKIILKENDNILKEIEKARNENKNKLLYQITDINKNNNFNSDDFNILRQIGQGSYGKIFEVEDKYHRHFALKKIIAYSLKEVELIKKEYNILYSLQNLEIDLIGIFGLETKKLDRTTYSINVLMELAKCDWEKEIKQRSSLNKYYTEKELIIILKKLVKTFSRLQKANVSHRDIKPQNILVCNGNNNLNLKIADFGEAKKIINKSGGDNNTIKQTIRGTELYMSPILFNSLRNKMVYKYTKHNTYKSDVFSLGYCMLLASSLSYKLLCEIRELKSMKDIENIVESYINKGISFYSEKYWSIIFNMLELDEKNRPDFIELENIVQDL
jgi:serine/threonine protein kinase